MQQAAELGPERLVAGRYRLVRRVGRGGTADIFLAVDEAASALCVAKILRDDHGQPDPDDAFARELESMGRLRHPNVVALLDSGRRT